MVLRLGRAIKEHIFLQHLKGKGKTIGLKNPRTSLVGKIHPQPREARPSHSSPRKVWVWGHHPGLCPLCLQLLVSGSSHQAKAPEEPQGLDFTWRLSLGYTWKGGLEREKAREKPHRSLTWGVRPSLKLPALSKALATDTGKVVEQFFIGGNFNKYWIIILLVKKSRTVDPLYFEINVCFWITHSSFITDSIETLSWSAHKYLWWNAFYFHLCTTNISDKMLLDEPAEHPTGK